MTEENEKQALAAVRAAFKRELVKQAGADRLIGMDTKFVPAVRQVRKPREGKEEKPLLFAGAAYAQLRLEDVQLVHYVREPGKKKVAEKKKSTPSTDTLRRVWERTVESHFPEGKVVADGKVHFILDPTFMGNRVQFGLSGVALASLPASLPPRPVTT